ncbi:MAG: enhanced serine sensitivity protein SseB C-terminal domain-containing protein [Planctomycetota bacterium]
MKRLAVPSGTKMLLGAPSKPMPRERSEALAQLASTTSGILEAHLPQMFAIGVMQEPAQVLVVCIAHSADQELVLSAIGHGLSKILPPDFHLDVWPVAPGSDMLADVRGVGCMIAQNSRKRPWWKLW